MLRCEATKSNQAERTNRVWRVLYAVTTEYFTKIFSTVNDSIWLAERERIVGVWELCLD
jgi:hypothetical protein